MERQPPIETLLSTYPRVRPQLSPRQRATYVEHYRSNRSGKQGLSKIVANLESWMHRRVAHGVTDGNLLEIGAGNLNHVPYIPVSGHYDVVEPFQELLAGSPYRWRTRCVYADIQEIPPANEYDCIFSVAVLEHLTDLPSVVAGAGLLLSEGGTFRAGIPSEGGLLWGIAWRLTTGIEYRLRRGLDYGAIMRHEHLNSASEIISLLNYFYGRVSISRFPSPFRNLSVYTSITADRPRLDRCRDFVACTSGSGVLFQ